MAAASSSVSAGEALSAVAGGVDAAATKRLKHSATVVLFM
jgi:hypothetical protein